MGHVTAASLAQDTEKYKNLLGPNGWTLNENDFLINSFSSGKRAGSMDCSSFMPKLQDTSVIYVCVEDLPGITGLDIADNGGWHVKKTKVRFLGENICKVKTDHTSSYAPIRLFGPKEFICQFETKQNPIALDVNGEGILKNHGIMFSTEKNGSWHLSGFRVGGGGFTGLRIFEGGSDSDVNYISNTSGILTNFFIHDTISEGIYLGSIKKYHTRFVNTTISQGFFINCGSEFGQWQNIGEGTVIENLTAINTGCEFPSPFQNNQVGGMQIKAGGGSFTVRNIYIENGGQPVINFFASAPVKDSTGKIIQEGCKPGDVYTIENIVSPKSKGHFLYVHKSCANGAEWVLDKIYCGGVTKRIATDTETTQPYAFLFDVPGEVTDKLTIKSITHDGSLPLKGKNGQKYNILSESTDTIAFAEFVKPMLCTDVVAFYDVYNQVSQAGWSYPVAGQPVKFRDQDLTYKNILGQPKEWFRVTANGTSRDPIFEKTVWESDHRQTTDSPWYNIAGVKQEEQPTNPCVACEQELNELEVKYNALLSDHNALLEENTNLTLANEQLSAENDQLKTENSNLVAENGQLKADYRHLQEVYLTLKGDIIKVVNDSQP